MNSQPKTALITGASRGVGKAIATYLARNGYRVITTSRSELSLYSLRSAIEQDGGSCLVVPADLSRDEDRKRLLATIDDLKNGLDAFIHCASPSPDPDRQSNLESTTDKEILEFARVNFEATAILLKHLLPALSKAGHSNVIVISSDWALRGSHGPPVFSASKAAVAQLLHTSRKNFASKNIQTTVIYPGDIATYDALWLEPKWGLDDSLDAIREELGDSRIALIDIAEMILFILSRKLMHVEEIVIAPLAGDYDY